MPTLTGRVTEDGRLDLDRLDLWRATLAKHKGQRVVVELRKKGEKRSGQSNRFWWGPVLRQLADELGYGDPDELHEHLVFKFRPLPPDPLTGAPRRMKTRDMEQEDFSKFVREVAAWAADLGVVLEGVEL